MSFTIREENGRAIASVLGSGRGEDWGAIINYGEKLPCCGCVLTSALSGIPDCDCHCHEAPRFWVNKA